MNLYEAIFVRKSVRNYCFDTLPPQTLDKIWEHYKEMPALFSGIGVDMAILMTGALKLDAVEDAGKFMIEIMPVMFIPAGVGLMESWGELKAVLVPVLVITLVSTIVVMVVSGRVTQAVIRLEKKHKGGDAK